MIRTIGPIKADAGPLGVLSGGFTEVTRGGGGGGGGGVYIPSAGINPTGELRMWITAPSGAQTCFNTRSVRQKQDKEFKTASGRATTRLLALKVTRTDLSTAQQIKDIISRKALFCCRVEVVCCG